MSAVATVIALLAYLPVCYFGLYALGIDDAFVPPYTGVSCALVTVVLIHFIQIKSPLVSKSASAIQALLFGLLVGVVSVVGDCVAGASQLSNSANLLVCAQSAGPAFAITALAAWVWFGFSLAALVRSLLLEIAGAQV